MEKKRNDVKQRAEQPSGAEKEAGELDEGELSAVAGGAALSDITLKRGTTQTADTVPTESVSFNFAKIEY